MIRMVMKGKVRDGMLSRNGIMAVLLAVLAASSTDAAPQALDPAYQPAVDALYNLDFSTAERTFTTLTQQHPDDPEYWNALASTYWLRILLDQEKLNVETFNGGMHGQSDAVNSAEEFRLRATIDSALKKANALLARNKNDVRALYSLGVSQATLASFEAIAKKSLWSAKDHAKSARNYHEQVLKLDPNYNDARWSVGIYDYMVGVVPGFWRFWLAMAGISGNKEEGIRNLEAAAAKGTRASTDAKMLLLAVYNREKRYADTIRLTNDLLAKYPRNFAIDMTRASTYGKMKDWNQALVSYQKILAKIQAKQDGYDRMRAERVHLEIGVSDVNRLKNDEAIVAFNQVISGAKALDDEKADALIWLGKIYDSKKDRPKALEQYRAVLKLNCDPGFKDAARKFIARPFK